MGKRDRLEEPDDPHVDDPHHGARVRMERLKRLEAIHPVLEAAGIDTHKIQNRAHNERVSYLDVIDDEIRSHDLTGKCDAAAKKAGV